MKLTVRLIRLLTGCLVVLLLHSANAYAQSWIVTYFETGPDSASLGIASLSEYVIATRRVEGNTGALALQQQGRPNQFVILEGWNGDEARETHGTSRLASEFRAVLDPLLISGYDERIYTGPEVDGELEAGPGAIYVVTHIDIGSRPRETGINLVREMARLGQQDEGNIRLLVLPWGTRDNHMSVVEVWESEEAHHRHLTADYMKKFRAQLTPLIGAMYDERVYSAVGSGQ